MEAADHVRDKPRFQILARHAELIHPEFDGFDRIRRIHDMVLGFVGFHKGGSHVQLVSVLGARPGIH